MGERESVLCVKSVRFTQEIDAMDVDGGGDGDWYFVVGTSISSIPNAQDSANNIQPEEDKEVCFFYLMSRDVSLSSL